MTVNGAVSWQGALNAQNQAFFQSADDMFVDFRWSASTLAVVGRRAPSNSGRSRYELWAGVDVEANGWNTSVNWDAIVPRDKAHITSFGLLPARVDAQSPASGRQRAGRLPRGRRPLLDRASPSTRHSPDGRQLARPGRVRRRPLDRRPGAVRQRLQHRARAEVVRGRPVTSDTAWNHLGLQDRLPSRRWVVRTEGDGPPSPSTSPTPGAVAAACWWKVNWTRPTTVDLYGSRLPLTR